MMHQTLNIPALFGFSIEVYFILLVIAIPIFFFCNRLFKKWIKKDNIRKITVWAVTVAATIVIYLGLISLLIYWISYTPSKDFTQQEWLTNRNERFQMAGDLIERKLLIGKDTNQVNQILGKVDWGKNHWRPDSINVWSYDMGSGGGGLGLIFHHLEVKFEHNKVITVEHIRYND